MAETLPRSIFHVSWRHSVASGILASSAWKAWPWLDEGLKIALSLVLGLGFFAVLFFCRWLFRKTPVAAPALAAPVQAQDPADDDLYVHAAAEIENRDHDAGTMARAWAESGGVTDAASALYIRLRVDRWRQERNAREQKELRARVAAQTRAQQESHAAILRGLAVFGLVLLVVVIMLIVAAAHSSQ